MKVAIVSNLYKPYNFGGAEISTELLAHGLLEAGHSPFVISMSMADRSYHEEIDGIRVYRLRTAVTNSLLLSEVKSFSSKVLWHARDLRNWLVLRECSSILNSEKPDIMHTNVLSGLSASVWRAGRGARIPIVHTIRDYYFLCLRSNLMSRGGRLCERRCTTCTMVGAGRLRLNGMPEMVVGISQFVLDKHHDHGAFLGIPSVVIRNAIPTIEWNQNTRISRRSDSPINVIFLGRVEAAKGPQVALDALAMLGDARISFHLCGDGPLLPKLQTQYGHDSRIIFEGRVEEDRKRELLKSADVMVAPSIWYEPFNRTVIEAYQYGIPVIASRIGGLPEIVKHDLTGYLIPPGDSAAMASILREISSNQYKLSELKQQACLYSKEFLLSDHVTRYEEVYRKLLRQ